MSTPARVQARVSAILRDLAHEKGHSQRQLADMAGMGQSTVSRAFTGQTVTVEHMVALCRALGVTPEDVFRQADRSR